MSSASAPGVSASSVAASRQASSQGSAPPVEGVVESREQGTGQVLVGGEQFVRRPDGGRPGGRGRTLLDAPDQGGQVGAVDRRVVEAAAGAAVGAVAVGVEPAAARAYDRAATAGLADSGQTELPRPDAGVGRDLVEGVAEDVEPGGGGALVGALERVDLFQLARRSR